MKRKTLIVLLILILIYILFGCGNDSSKPPTQTITYGTDNIEYRVVTIDSCEYIFGWRGGGYGGPFLTHKGNCKNPIHKINKITVIDTVEYKLVRK